MAATHDPAVSRLTLVTVGEDTVIEQILQQSSKLLDVLDIADLTAREHLEVELLIAKLAAEPAVAPQLAACVRRHPRALIFDESPGTRTVQFAGSGSEINAFRPNRCHRPGAGTGAQRHRGAGAREAWLAVPA